VAFSAADVYDSQMLKPLVDADPPAKLRGDKGYDYPALQRALQRQGITLRIARAASSPTIAWADIAGRWNRHWAWVLAFCRLTVRYDRHAASVLAFLHLACALICLRFLRRAETV